MLVFRAIENNHESCFAFHELLELIIVTIKTSEGFPRKLRKTCKVLCLLSAIIIDNCSFQSNLNKTWKTLCYTSSILVDNCSIHSYLKPEKHMLPKIVRVNNHIFHSYLKEALEVTKLLVICLSWQP